MANPCILYLTAHGASAGSRFYLTTTGTLPSPLVANTTYYIITEGLTANSFEFSATPSGTAIATSGLGTGVHTIYIYPQQNTYPTVCLDWSDDGGHTWSNQHWRSIGKIGRYKDRAIWRGLGLSTGRVFRLTMSDDVKRVMIAAYADIEELR